METNDAVNPIDYDYPSFAARLSLLNPGSEAATKTLSSPRAEKKSMQMIKHIRKHSALHDSLEKKRRESESAERLDTVVLLTP